MAAEIRYRRLVSYFLVPLQETRCLFLGSVKGDSLPVFWSRYRRLVACFLDPLQETVACFSDLFTLTIWAKSAILELKGGSNEIFTLCMMLKEVIYFIYEIFLFGDRVPLIAALAERVFYGRIIWYFLQIECKSDVSKSILSSYGYLERIHLNSGLFLTSVNPT